MITLYPKKIICGIIWILGLSLLIKLFIFQLFTVPSGSMEPTLLIGDNIIVSKLHYGPRISIGFIRGEHFSSSFIRLPGISRLKRGDVVVFNSVLKTSTIVVKRCVGLPNDILRISAGNLFINAKQLDFESELFDYKVFTRNIKRSNAFLDSLNIPSGGRSFKKDKKFFLLTINLRVAETLKKSKFYDSLWRVVKPGGNNSNLFPPCKQNDWSRDYYGPIWIPAKGKKILLSQNVFQIYKHFIRGEGNFVEQKGNRIFINGKPASSYQFKKDYCFVMGDNRHHSYDSRWIGFIATDLIIGRAMFISWSKNPITDIVRIERTLSLIN